MLTYHLYTLSKPVIPNVFSRHIRDMWDAKVMLPQPISKFLLKNLLGQVQLASANLAKSLKNSFFGVEKPSFFLGLKFSFFATLRT